MSASKKKPLSLDAAVNVLAFAFDDPVKSGICASRMRVAVVRVEDELVARESMNDKVKFAKSIPKLLRSSIRFLTRPLPRAEYVAMIDYVLRCRCNRNDPKIRALHHPGLHSPDGSICSEDMISLRTTVQIIVQLIGFALSGMTKNKFRSLEGSLSESSIKPWPYDVDDLLPYGLKDSIAALTLWERQAGGFHIFRLATSLGTFYQPFMDALVRDPKYEFALLRPLSMVSDALGWFEADPAKYSTQEGNADNIVCDPIDIAFDLWFNLYSTVLFIRGIMALSSTIIPVMERLRRVLPSFPATDYWKDRIKAGCETMLSIAKGDVDDRQEQATAPASEHERIKDAVQEMSWARKGGCYHVHCPQNLDTAYARLCSKCDVVRYCTEEVS